MKKKTIALLLVMMMVFGITVGGTIAYLQDSKQVVNTFTVGNVKIGLTESKTNVNGEFIDANGKVVETADAAAVWTGVDVNATSKVGNSYKLMPGHTYKKNPTVTVEAGSEKCWLYVKVENGIEAIEDEANDIAAQITANGWTPLADVDDVYYMLVEASATATTKVVFESFKLADDADTTNTDAAYATKNITITAYAVQYDGLETSAADAWNATFGA